MRATTCGDAARLKVGVGASYTETNKHTKETTASPAELTAGGNMYLDAKDNILIEGAQMLAEKNMSLQAGNDIAILSATNTKTEKCNRFNAEAFAGLGATVGTTGAGAGWSLAASMGGGKDKRSATEHVNAGLVAGEAFLLHSGRDTTIAGANILAPDVILDVGRNFTLASVENDVHGSSSSWNIGAEVTFGFGFALDAASGNVSVGWGKEKGNLVAQQTSIMAGKSLLARVGEHTHIRGAVLAALTDNLTLDTGSLSYENMHARNGKPETNLGITWAASLNDIPTGGKDTPEPGKEPKPEPSALKQAWDAINKSPVKPGKIAYTDAKKEQNLYATVGAGTINIRNTPNADLGGLNRDVSKAITEKSSKISFSVDILKLINDINNVPNALANIREAYADPRTFNVKKARQGDFMDAVYGASSIDPGTRDSLKAKMATIEADTRLTRAEKIEQVAKLVDDNKNQAWMPQYANEEESGISFKIDYTLDKIKRQYKTLFK